MLFLITCFTCVRLYVTLLMDYNSPGFSIHGLLQASTGVGCYVLLQGIFPTQDLNPGLLHCRQIFHNWATREALNSVWKWDSLVAHLVKNLPAMQTTCVWSLGGEDPLEKQMVTHSSTLAWRIPWTEEPGGLQSMGSQRVGHNWETNTSFLTCFFGIGMKTDPF